MDNPLRLNLNFLCNPLFFPDFSLFGRQITFHFYQIALLSYNCITRKFLWHNFNYLRYLEKRYFFKPTFWSKQFL